LYLFSALIEYGKFHWLIVLGVINSVIALFYYFRIVKHMWLVDNEKELKHVPSNTVVGWLIILFTIPTLFFGVYWVPILGFINNSLEIWH